MDYKFEDSLIEQVERKINILRTELLKLFQESIDQKEREIIDLKRRLIAPEISFEELSEKIFNSDFQQSEAVFFMEDSPVESLLRSYSEDSRWFWGVNNLGLSPTAASNIVLEALIHYFSAADFNGSIETGSLSSLIARVAEHAKNEQLGKETIFSWLKIKLNDSDKPDEMTSNLLANMIETILDEYTPAQIREFSETLDSELSLEEHLQNSVIQLAKGELNH